MLFEQFFFPPLPLISRCDELFLEVSAGLGLSVSDATSFSSSSEAQQAVRQAGDGGVRACETPDAGPGGWRECPAGIRAGAEDVPDFALEQSYTEYMRHAVLCCCNCCWFCLFSSVLIAPRSSTVHQGRVHLSG